MLSEIGFYPAHSPTLPLESAFLSFSILTLISISNSVSLVQSSTAEYKRTQKLQGLGADSCISQHDLPICIWVQSKEINSSEAFRYC